MWKIAETICCDGSDVIVERILFIGFFVQTYSLKREDNLQILKQYDISTYDY